MDRCCAFDMVNFKESSTNFLNNILLPLKSWLCKIDNFWHTGHFRQKEKGKSVKSFLDRSISKADLWYSLRYGIYFKSCKETHNVDLSQDNSSVSSLWSTTLSGQKCIFIGIKRLFNLKNDSQTKVSYLLSGNVSCPIMFMRYQLCTVMHCI